MLNNLPLGKLPHDLLASLLTQAPILDSSVILGPGIGLDCAVLEVGGEYLVAKSDPITFASDEIGWYLVNINANDIVTTGATPRWLLVTALLPEGSTNELQVKMLFNQITAACRQIEVSLVGGHSEITASVSRPVLIGTMFGVVEKQNLVTPRGARSGDMIILTKCVPIEATAVLAREFRADLEERFSPDEIMQAADYLHNPGISVLQEAMLATESGKVTAMHDPTEGGLATALWELAEASGKTLVVDLKKVPISNISRKLCDLFDIDPLGAIASGALLLTASVDDGVLICQALEAAGISARAIGKVLEGKPQVLVENGIFPRLLSRPKRDEIAKLYEHER